MPKRQPLRKACTRCWEYKISCDRTTSGCDKCIDAGVPNDCLFICKETSLISPQASTESQSGHHAAQSLDNVVYSQPRLPTSLPAYASGIQLATPFDQKQTTKTLPFRKEATYGTIVCLSTTIVPNLDVKAEGFDCLDGIGWVSQPKNDFCVDVSLSRNLLIRDARSYLKQDNGRPSKLIKSINVTINAVDDGQLGKTIDLEHHTPPACYVGSIPQFYFKWVKFKSETANNGSHRRGTQQCYKLIITLWANVQDPHARVPEWVAITTYKSDPIIALERTTQLSQAEHSSKETEFHPLRQQTSAEVPPQQTYKVNTAYTLAEPSQVYPTHCNLATPYLPDQQSMQNTFPGWEDGRDLESMASNSYNLQAQGGLLHSHAMVEFATQPLISGYPAAYLAFTANYPPLDYTSTAFDPSIPVNTGYWPNGGATYPPTPINMGYPDNEFPVKYAMEGYYH